MRLALVILLTLSASAFANTYKRPASPPGRTQSAELIAAEKAWSVAETEKDAKKSIALWEAAAVAFDKAVPTVDKQMKADAAYAAVLAWKNAMALDTKAPPATTQPLSARDLGFLDSVLTYIPFAPADEVPGLHFLRGTTFLRHDQFDDAIPIFEDIVSNFTTSDMSEYAANLLLDALNRQGKIDRMLEWTAKMRAMPKLLAKRPDLVETVDRIHITAERKEAEKLEASGEWSRCARSYEDAARSVPKYARRDELLFNAAVCFEKANEIADAVRMYRAVQKLKTSLAPRAKAAAAKLRP